MFSALKSQVPQLAKKRFGVYQKLGKKLVFEEKRGKNIYTKEPFRCVCVCVCGGGPFRTVLVYRFWPPKLLWPILIVEDPLQNSDPRPHPTNKIQSLCIGNDEMEKILGWWAGSGVGGAMVEANLHSTTDR